jgi:hypothetical protein
MLMSLNERDYMRNHPYISGREPTPAAPLLARIKFALWSLFHPSPSTLRHTPLSTSDKLPEQKENENDK